MYCTPVSMGSCHAFRHVRSYENMHFNIENEASDACEADLFPAKWKNDAIRGEDSGLLRCRRWRF